MIDLKNVTLLDILPKSLKNDTQIQAISAALSPELQEITVAIEETLLMANLDAQPEEVVDLLAWQKHVDFYESTLSIEQKRELVRQSDGWHQRKGTPWAVEQVVSIIFSNAKVTEWFEYGGEPGYFRVEVGQVLTADIDLDRLVRLIDATKRKSAWLEDVTVKRSISMDLVTCGFVSDSKVTEIYPIAFQMPTITSDLIHGGAISISNTNTIMPEVI